MLLSNPLPSRRLFLATTLSAVFLTACGGGGSDGSDSATDVAAEEEQTVSGTIVVPETTQVSTLGILSKSPLKRLAPAAAAPLAALATDSCGDVPAGYQALPGLIVEFLDIGNEVVATLTTDNCGAFTGSVPASAINTRIVLNKVQSLDFDIGDFIGKESRLVSTLPENAELVISVIQGIGEGKVALTVTDSASGKAVLGLDESHLDLLVNNNPASLSDLSYGAAIAQNMSVSLVMDASSSMTFNYYDQVSQQSLEPFTIANLATHTFLDGLEDGTDEVGMVVFSSAVTTLNDEYLQNLSWVDANGSSVPDFQFSATGLSRQMSDLHTLADIYDPQSEIYSGFRLSEKHAKHPLTTEKFVASVYPWGGSTSLYDGTMAGLDLVKLGSNPRKLIVAMTDGFENSSDSTLDDVIDRAKNEGVPVYTVGFGSENDVGVNELEKLAVETGGEFSLVEGSNLTSLFQSIQTGVRFQYVATLGSPLPGGAALSVTVEYAGNRVTRELNLP